MSFLLIFLGLMMVIAAVRNTQHCLIQIAQHEFEGPGNFTYWVAGILIIGALGMSETLRPLSNGLLALILIALFLTRGSHGLFNQLTSALKSTGGGGGTSVNINPTGLINNFLGGSAQ